MLEEKIQNLKVHNSKLQQTITDNEEYVKRVKNEE